MLRGGEERVRGRGFHPSRERVQREEHEHEHEKGNEPSKILVWRHQNRANLIPRYSCPVSGPPRVRIVACVDGWWRV